MNIYVATRGNLVGVVLTGTHNQIYHYKAYKTQTKDAEAQTILATQMAVAFARNNDVIDAGNYINLYADKPVDLEKLQANEYLSRFNYPVTLKEPQTSGEEQRMLLANTEIDMEIRRSYMKAQELQK